MKAQIVRLADVLYIGPVLVLIGLRANVQPWQRTALVVIGLATIGYNLENYRKLL